ncbi:MAG: hypothetical protein M3P85_10975 [Actinomycetota bacterium]|nr:hypothetical protein [Actinomycetota bacterium]
MLLASVAGMITAGRLMQEPTFIREITVENPTRYDIEIQVTDGDRDGGVSLGTARRASTSTFQEIYDQGDVWIFRFTAQGEEGGELSITRTELERTSWHVEIPEAVGDELRAKGAAFPP